MRLSPMCAQYAAPSCTRHTAHGRARPRVDALTVAQPRHFVVRPAQRQVQKAHGIEHRQRRVPEGIQQAFQCCIGGAAAIGMATHAVDHDQQRRLVVGGYRNPVLVVLTITDQTYICMLDPQARAPAGRLFQLLHLAYV